MAKRMDISCLLFTVPTSLERKTSASQSLCSVSSTRRRVPCSVGMEKVGCYTGLDGATFRPQPTLRVNLGCRAGSVCKAQSLGMSWPGGPTPPRPPLLPPTPRRSQPGGLGGLQGKIPHTLQATEPALEENVHITWGLRTSFTI